MARQLNDAFTEIAGKASPAVVVIEVTGQVDDSAMTIVCSTKATAPTTPRPAVDGQGSGIILSEDGYIRPIYHVVDNADKIDVILKDGTVFHEVPIRGADPESDIAILTFCEGRRPPGSAIQRKRASGSSFWRLALRSI